MNKKILVILTFSLVLSCTGYAGNPLVSIVALVKAPKQLALNAMAQAVYQVTNNTRTLHSFVMQPIQGITLNPLGNGACPDPIELGYGQSCMIYLQIRGSQIASQVSGGPVICNNNSSPLGCSQPINPADSLAITRTPMELNEGASNTWISALIANYEAPSDPTTWINKVYTLAPMAEQIHIRVDAGASGCSSAAPANCQEYVDLIAQLRNKYAPNPILIGYHPDDSKDSYTDWGCTKGNWQCIVNASILAMNAIDAIADPNQTGAGFNIFSLEQSYQVPEDAPSLRNLKACLNPPDATTGGVCPAGITTASPPYVKLGWVLPSYGGCPYTPQMPPCDNEYGTDALDYGYPQYYNLGPKINTYTALITNGFFPSYSTQCISHSPYPDPLYVVDEDNGAVPYSPEIPCPDTAAGQTSSNVFTYPDPTTGKAPNLTLATSYLAYIMSQLPPISDNPNVNGATVYLTFSGEGPAQYPSLFLGAPGWTLQEILQFYLGINANLTVLYGLYPPTTDPMFRTGVFSGGIQPTAIKYAIWNFSSILDNIPD